jgi:hypothetical protein
MSCSKSEAPAGTASDAARASPAADTSATSASRAMSLRFFVSGHSLTERPFADYLTGIARGFGIDAQWNGQHIAGSTIKLRSRGRTAEPQWSGYRSGENRDGEGLDVIAEFREPRTVVGGPYEALIVTEEHSVLWTLLREDSVRHLRHYHDRFIEGHAEGATFFYEPWIDVDDKSDPSRWIELERASSRVWRCVVERVNVSLAAAGRPDRIASLPAGVALTQLVERAIEGALPGVGGDAAEAVTAIIYDDVHLTPLGSYYQALIAFATITGRPVDGAWAPPELPRAQAEALQGIATQFVARYREELRPIGLEECRSLLRDDYIAKYWSYVRETQWRDELGTPRAYVRYLRWLAESHYRFAGDGHTNPFHHDPETDASYWLPGP